jgi:predicted nucleic acid-binding protein
VFAAAADLSQRYSARVLTRTLDLLHVAAARALSCSRFVSADDRQLAAAKAIGLRTVDIKR